MSTEVVPPKPKELTASQLLKAQKEKALQEKAAVTGTPQTPASSSTSTVPKTPTTPTASSLPTVQGISPNTVSAIVSSSPNVIVRKVEDTVTTNASSSNNKGMTKLLASSTSGQVLEQEAPVSCKGPTHLYPPVYRYLNFNVKCCSVSGPSERQERQRTSSVSESQKSSRSSTSSTASSTKSTKEKLERRESLQKIEIQKESARMDGPSSEKLYRDNMRKTLKEILRKRSPEMSASDIKKMESLSNSPDILAVKIEEELVSCFGGASNIKCKNKYRSIHFNLKDEKNGLFQEILLGNIKPYDLVRMTPDQMAPSELAQWRKQEEEKGLEAIKRAELDKLAEAKKQELIEKGVTDAVQVAEETKPLDISDVIVDPEEEQKRKREKKEKDKERSSSLSSHHHKDKDREHHRHSSSSSHRDKDRELRSRDKEKDKDHKSSSRDKDKHRSSDKDKEKDKKSERERHGSSSGSSGSRHKSSHDKEKEKEREKSKSDHGSSSSSRRSDRHRDKDKESSLKDKDKDRDSSSSTSSKVKNENKEKESRSDKDKSSRHTRSKVRGFFIFIFALPFIFAKGKKTLGKKI